MLPSLILLVLCHLLLLPSIAQQVYTNNAMLACYNNKSASTLGYSCNGAHSTCSSYATFRSATNYQTPISIGYFLGASARDIAQLNNVTDVHSFPLNRLVLVPLNCSCSNTTTGGSYYQHDSSYSFKSETEETYLILANNTYQGLSTCQAMMEQNPTHESRELKKGMVLKVPLRCACPTTSQIDAGYRYLLTYLVTWKDGTSTIAELFATDERAILTANSLSEKHTIYPFTTLLIPLKTPPTTENLLTHNSPPPPAASSSNSSNEEWIPIGVGIGAGVVAICAVLLAVLFFNRRRRRRRRRPVPENGDLKGGHHYDYHHHHRAVSSSSAEYSSGCVDTTDKRVYSTSSGLSEEASLLVGSLAVYKYEDLQKATGFFGEGHRIQGSSVYRGVINGDLAAVKRMKGDVSKEVGILRNMNHSNLVRLSGFCLHKDSTYLVFEFAEMGSLHGWLHSRKSGSLGLGWRLRVQIAHDVADALNYLHNYTSPPCIHKDLNSSNVLLDAEFRAKISNFGLARSAAAEEGGGGGRLLQLTSHVVGTQGYMSPEYLEHGVVSPKLDIFAFGVLLLELISGKEAVYYAKDGEQRGEEALLFASIRPLLQGDDARDKLKQLVDPCLGYNYPFESVFAMAQLAKQCVARGPSSRPTIAEVYVALSGIHSAVLDWDSCWEKTKPSSTIGRGG